MTPLLCLGTGGNFFLLLANYFLSTILNDLIPRSICHCKYAAIIPLACLRDFTSDASATPQSPINKADIKSKVSWEGVTDPEGLHSSHTAPPVATEKFLCGPGLSHLAHSKKDGEYPAIESDLSKYESRIKSDQFADFLRNNKSVLREALPPQAMQDVMEIGLLNSKIGKPEAGAFNYSNSYTSLIGDLAKQGLLAAGEAKLAGATGGVSIPVVGLGKQFVEKFNKDAFANSQRNPYGGLTKD